MSEETQWLYMISHTLLFLFLNVNNGDMTNLNLGSINYIYYAIYFPQM